MPPAMARVPDKEKLRNGLFLHASRMSMSVALRALSINVRILFADIASYSMSAACVMSAATGSSQFSPS
jgi:hypothetical protein